MEIQNNAQSETKSIVGFVSGLYLHSQRHNGCMITVPEMEFVAKNGIANNLRYYGKVNTTSRRPNKNHVSLIECEQIAEHEECLGKEILPGRMRSNLEIYGLKLTDFIGHQMKIGSTAIVYVYKARITCRQMDDVHFGLQKLTRNEKLGVIAEIVVSGTIKIGDCVTVIE